MHILLVVDYFAPHIGGIEKLFSDLSNFLIQQGHKVTILTSRHDSSLPRREIISPQFQIYRVSSGRNTIRRYALRFGLHQKNLFQSIDLIHTSTFSACIAARLLAWRYSKPITITIHELYLKMRYLLKGWKGIFYRLYEYILIRIPWDHIITPSDFTKNTILGQYSRCISPITTVYNQIDYDFWTHPPKSPVPENFPSHGKKLGLFMGRLGKEKGLDILISALPSIQIHYPDFQLIIVTSSHHGEKEHILQLVTTYHVADMIIRQGPLTTEQEIKDLMQSCTVGIVPSISEGFCYTAVQMQALGLPLIVTERGALPEVLDRQSTVFVPYGDSEALAQGVIASLSGPLVVSPSKKFAHTLSGYTDIFSVIMIAR